MRIAIVGKYPPPKLKHTRFSGEYTKNLATSLLCDNSKRSLEIIIFANKLNNVNASYIEDGIQVIPCWDKNLLFIFKILKKIVKYKPKIVHLQHELFYYGGILSAFIFPIVLLVLKFLKIHSIVTIHGVVPLSQINKEFMKQNRIKGYPIFSKLCLLFIIRNIVYFSSTIIVHEEFSRQVLQNQYKCRIDKVKVIPLGIEVRNDGIDNERAKKTLGMLGKKIILYFGFITGYKGIELLIDSFKFLVDKHFDYLLVIAGGEHPRLKNKPSYQRYLTNLHERAKAISTSQIIFTGFTQEDKIPLYFSATDVLILPYTTAMSSSGPLTLAISYNLPFLVSQPLGNLIELEYVKFRLDPKSLAEKIEEFFSNSILRERTLAYNRCLKKERLWSNVGRKTLELYLKF